MDLLIMFHIKFSLYKLYLYFYNDLFIIKILISYIKLNNNFNHILLILLDDLIYIISFIKIQYLYNDIFILLNLLYYLQYHNYLLSILINYIIH